MKHVKKIKYIFMLTLLVTVLLPFNVASAIEASKADYTPQIGSAIEHNCANLKNTFKDLRKRDISSRVARVYVYDFLLLRTNAFATRLSKNQLNSTLVANDNTALQNALNKFKSDYNNYDDSLLSLIASDCQQPQVFYQNLRATRKLRQTLAKDVSSLNKYWQQITKDISDVKLTSLSSRSGQN